MKATQRDNAHSRASHPGIAHEAELKSLLWYIPKTQKVRARELVLWLFPQFKTEKTWQAGVERLFETTSFWEKPSELRHLGAFVDLLDKTARRNRVRQKHPPAVENLVWEVFCWCHQQDDSRSVSEIVSCWRPKVCSPLERLLRAVERREASALENLLKGYVESQ